MACLREDGSLITDAQPTLNGSVFGFLSFDPIYMWATQRAAVGSWPRCTGWRRRVLLGVGGRPLSTESGIRSIGAKRPGA